MRLSPNMNPVDTIAVNAAPWHPIFTPDGKLVYVGNKRKNTVNVTISFHGVVGAHCENFKLGFVKNRPCRLPTPEPFLPAGPIDAR